MWSRRAVALGLAAAAVVPAARAQQPGRAYRRAWRQATRKLVIYRGFGTALLLRATLLEPPFRALLADERHRLLGAADTGDAAFRERMARDGAAYHEVVIAADSGEEQDPRFGLDDGRWHLRMEVDGREAPLVQVERVRRPSPVHRALYPQLDIWSELWIARFARQSDHPARIVLHVGSGYGHGAVTWALSALR